MTPPRVSFVIPTLNSAATLEPCLRSITEQNYRKLDIVIVDGGSRDSTLDMASKYGARVLSRTGTLGLARQVGCEASRGDVLGIFDSDVVLPNVNWLTGAVAHFQSNSRVAVVWPINAAPPNSSRVTKSYFQLWRAFMEDRRAGTVLPGGNSLVLKRVFDEVGGFDVRLQFGEDFDLTRKIIAAGFEVAIHTDPIYHNTMRTLREFTTKQIKAAASLSAIMRRNRGLGQRLIWESMTWSPQRTGRVSQPLPLQAVRQMMVGVMWPTQKESQGGGVRSLLLIPTLLSIRLMIYAPYYTFAKLLTQEEAAYPRVRTVTEEKTSQFPEGEIRKAPLPKVSFVIPVLNSQRTLERCLSTINEQNYPSVELVVVDNGCTDKSIPIAIEHGAKVLACQGPLGKVRQFGHQNSSGELLAFWDSDLYIPRSDWLRNAVFCLLRHPRASTLWVLKDPPREAPVVSWAYNWLTWSVLLTLLGKGIGYLGGGGSIFRRQALDSVGGINPSIDTGEDFDIARKLAFSGFEVVFYRDLVYHDSHLSISELLAKDLRRAKNFGMFPLEAQTGISLQEYLFCHVKVGIFEALQNLFSERETFYAVVPIVLVCRIMVYLVMSPFNILSRQRWSKPRITQTRITP